MKHTISLVSIIAAGAIASLIISHHAKIALQEKDGLLRQRESESSELTATNAHLTNQLAHATAEATNATAELARLRSKVESLRQQTNTLAQKKENAVHPKAAPVEHSEEFWEQLHKSAAARTRDAMTFGRALWEYADKHDKQIPSSPDQIASALDAAVKDGARWSGTNQFEIVYQSSLDRLEGLPFGSVAVVRSQPWVGPDGEERRIYGFMDGHSQMVTSDAAPNWEKDHVFLFSKGK